MLKSSHIDAYAPVLRFSRLAMKQNPGHLSSYSIIIGSACNLIHSQTFG